MEEFLNQGLFDKIPVAIASIRYSLDDLSGMKIAETNSIFKSKYFNETESLFYNHLNDVDFTEIKNLLLQKKDFSYKFHFQIDKQRYSNFYFHCISNSSIIVDDSDINLNDNYDSKYKTIFNSITEGVALHEIIYENNRAVNYKILEVNPGYEKHTGFKAEEVMGKKITDLFPQITPPHLEIYEKIANDGIPYSFDIYYPKLLKYFKISVVSPKKGQFVTVFEDISDKKETEKFLRKVNRDLEMANQRANEMAMKAEIANQTKSRFLANVSHEIRTPMNAIIGLSHILSEKLSNPEFKAYIDKIQLSSKTLLNILNDILDYSKIESGSLLIERRTFLLNEVLQNVINMFEDRAIAKGLEFEVEIAEDLPLFVNGDSLRLGQILINLLSNAVKFTEKGKITFKAELIKSKHDYINKRNALELRFTVKDTGIGIDAAKVATIFTPFEQADATISRKYGGTGLGLSICKKLSELMGGKVWLESALNLGSAFIIDLPFIQDYSLKSFSSLTNKAGLNILYLDDNKISLELYKRIVSSLDFNIDIYDSIETRNKLNNNKQYDFVFICCKYINQITYLRDMMPFSNFILVIDSDNSDERLIYDEKLIDGTISKPFSVENVFNTLIKYCMVTPSCVKKQINDELALVNNYEDYKDKKILLVEDNKINQEVAGEFLQAYGISVDFADNGKIAYEMISKFKYDLVLMDIQMPEMDGFDTTKMLRSDVKNKELPIIAMTAHAMSGDREKCIKAGMNDYISKPFEPEELQRILKIYLGINVAINKQKDGLPDSMPGLQIVDSINRIGGNIKLYLRLINQFNLDLEKDLSEIEDNLSERKLDDLLRNIHTLKGTSANLGAFRISEVCKIIESKIKNSEDFDAEFNTLKDCIAEFLENARFLTSLEIETEKDKQKSDNQSIGDLIKSLENLAILIKNDAFIDEEYLMKISQFMPKDDAVLNSFNAIVEDIISFNYINANNNLKDFIRNLNQMNKK